MAEPTLWAQMPHWDGLNDRLSTMQEQGFSQDVLRVKSATDWTDLGFDAACMRWLSSALEGLRAGLSLWIEPHLAGLASHSRLGLTPRLETIGRVEPFDALWKYFACYGERRGQWWR